MITKYETSLEGPGFRNSKKKMEVMMEHLEVNDKWTPQTVQAARDLMFERMVYSSKNGKEKFLEYMNETAGSPKLTELIKRFNLFDDNKARKIDSRVDDFIISEKSTYNKSQRDIVDYYRKRVDDDGDTALGIAVYNDNPIDNADASIITSYNRRIKAAAKTDISLRIDPKKPVGKDNFLDFETAPSSFAKPSKSDSATKISPRFAEYLRMHYGVPESNIFKVPDTFILLKSIGLSIDG